MRLAKLLLLSAAGFSTLCIGCRSVASLQPVADEKTLFFDQSLPGTWEQAQDEKPSVVSVAAGPNKTYLISLVDEDDENKATSVYTCQLFRIGEATYYDLWFSWLTVGSKSYLPGDLAVYTPHFFGRVWISQNEIRVGALDGDWLEEQLNAKKVKLAYMRPPKGSGIDFLLTGSSEKLRSFASKYAENAKAFVPSVWKRRK